MLTKSDTKLIKLEVIVTEAKIFAEDSSANMLVQDFLRDRVKSQASPDEFEFSKQANTIIEEIHARFQKLPLDQLGLPANEPFLDDFEITKDSIKEEDLDSFKQKLLSIIFADSRLFFKLITSQGYDLHLTKAVLPTYDLSHCG